MRVELTKRYVKDFKKLHTVQKNRVTDAFHLFKNDPFAPALHNHRLKGRQENLRSISAGFDLRIIYREERNHTVIFLLRVGSHEQVYR